jgi:ATP-dependent helicase/nuclease subunit A
VARRREPAPDQAERDAAIRERGRNVLIDAGAGTGKTAILVDRLVEMVAPTTGARPVPLRRMAAITFTRKAAGELRLRIRERLLEELAEHGLAGERQILLREALAELDTAWVGTIHGFADRLLRLRPVEAELSPGYHIAEDEAEGDLVRETWTTLLHAVQSETLEAELAGTPAAGRAAEATRTVEAALAAGLRAASHESEHGTYFGLDALVGGFVRRRDVPPADAEAAGFDAAAFRRAAEEFVAVATLVRGTTPGARCIRETADAVARLRAETDPARLFRQVRRALDRPTPGRARSSAATRWPGARGSGSPRPTGAARRSGTRCAPPWTAGWPRAWPGSSRW